MNAKPFLVTTSEDVARAELAPNGDWDVWAYFGCGSNYVSLANCSKERMLASKEQMLGKFASFTRKFAGWQ